MTCPSCGSRDVWSNKSQQLGFTDKVCIACGHSWTARQNELRRLFHRAVNHHGILYRLGKEVIAFIGITIGVGLIFGFTGDFIVVLGLRVGFGLIGMGLILLVAGSMLRQNLLRRLRHRRVRS